MSYFSRYDKGDWKALCDVCGREFKASQLNKRWDGLMCCRQDWEPRQPQDFVRGVADPQLVPWTRPEPSDDYIPVTTGSWWSFLTNITASLDIAVIIHNVKKTITFLVSSVTSLTTNTVPAPAPSQQAVNGDAINNQSLG
jgi:hypothetical protein